MDNLWTLILFVAMGFYLWNELTFEDKYDLYDKTDRGSFWDIFN